MLASRILLHGKGKHHEFDTTTRHFFLEGSGEVIEHARKDEKSFPGSLSLEHLSQASSLVESKSGRDKALSLALSLADSRALGGWWCDGNHILPSLQGVLGR